MATQGMYAFEKKTLEPSLCANKKNITHGNTRRVGRDPFDMDQANRETVITSGTHEQYPQLQRARNQGPRTLLNKSNSVSITKTSATMCRGGLVVVVLA